MLITKKLPFHAIQRCHSERFAGGGTDGTGCDSAGGRVESVLVFIYIKSYVVDFGRLQGVEHVDGPAVLGMRVTHDSDDSWLFGMVGVLLEPLQGRPQLRQIGALLRVERLLVQ